MTRVAEYLIALAEQPGTELAIGTMTKSDARDYAQSLANHHDTAVVLFWDNAVAPIRFWPRKGKTT